MYNLSYKYDQEGFHEKKQRDLRQRIQAIKSRDQSNADSELILRNTNGQIMMNMSNFDFIEKPQGEVSPKRVARSNLAKEKIAKIFNEMQKAKNAGKTAFDKIKLVKE